MNSDQLLIRVTVANASGDRESTLYRVPADARFVEVLAATRERSSLNNPFVTGINPLGTLEPHLRKLYAPLMED